jgi:hypothetical protein
MARLMPSACESGLNVEVKYAIMRSMGSLRSPVVVAKGREEANKPRARIGRRSMGAIRWTDKRQRCEAHDE